MTNFPFFTTHQKTHFKNVTYLFLITKRNAHAVP